MIIEVLLIWYGELLLIDLSVVWFFCLMMLMFLFVRSVVWLFCEMYCVIENGMMLLVLSRVLLLCFLILLLVFVMFFM